MLPAIASPVTASPTPVNAPCIPRPLYPPKPPDNPPARTSSPDIAASPAPVAAPAVIAEAVAVPAPKNGVAAPPVMYPASIGNPALNILPNLNASGYPVIGFVVSEVPLA